ncbi:GTPase domain-containing protein [Candidatus Contubernalis alkaliaceticus]|uniref:GTPase domain-containing protein n=1 Tax=Candidatus Contubernalis alkaliaceticus TaxID=338645 RepID=UPI001F4BE170|nr:GTPase domain-containing protein [Candidatus Contubernalis alkalaceticus]UNC91899.1 GTPase domain-containing protein [Candidatus Contubernalis alkalaceticus]
MKNCLVIGKPNVGKTLFVINFAIYLGLKKIKFTFVDSLGRQHNRDYTKEMAKKYLTGVKPHHTRCLQKITIKLAEGKGKKNLILTDSTGLKDGIHPKAEIRKAMAQTLESLLEADLILHMVDISKMIYANRESTILDMEYIDRQIMDLGRERSGYLLLINKIDLLQSYQNREKIKQQFSGIPVFLISSVTGEGFPEVKSYVWNSV